MIPNTKIRQIFLIIIIVLIAIAIFWQLKPFFATFLASYTLFILLKNWHINLVEKKKLKPGLSATSLIILSIVIIVIPLNLMVKILADKLIPLISNYPQILSFTEQKLHEFEQKYNIEILTPGNLKSATDWIGNNFQNMAGATINGAIGLFLVFFILFFLLTEHKKVDKGLHFILPISKKNTQFLQKELNELVVSNAIGIPLVALVQAIAGLIIYSILGIPDAFLWFLATCIASVIPVFGSMLVYVPLSILLFTQGLTKEAGIMLAYGILVIGSVDNIFRFWLQKWIGDIHPLITLFGVIIGIELFGFIGLIFGPILLSLLLLFFKIYHLEYIAQSEEPEK
ncbi:MAG: AI-2E family transporter [Saprospiraceae bacterium]